MFHRSLLILAIFSLTLSAGAAWANSVFVDMSDTNANLKAWPTGVSAAGGVILEGYYASSGTYRFPYVYPAGTAPGTLTNITSNFTYSGSSATNVISSAMAANGLSTITEANIKKVGWSYSGGTSGTATPFVYSGSSWTQSLDINSNGDICGHYQNAAGTSFYAFIYSGGSLYALNADPNRPQGGGGSYAGMEAVALNAAGQACGFNQTAPVNTNYATVWTYSISGGSMTSTGLDLQQNGLTAAWNAAYGTTIVSSQGLAINSSGTVLVGGSDSISQSFPYGDDGYLLYNMGSKQYTSLGSLMIWDPQNGFGSAAWCGGHEQAINDSGAVVGYTGTQGSTWHAAIWQNGTITDLNTLYAGILPAGFVLNNATAIDNNGDIVGYGTDASSNTYQAFEILNVATPEPGTMALLMAGLVGLVAYAWRKRT